MSQDGQNTRRYPALPLAFEQQIAAAIAIGRDIGRNYVMNDDGEIVPRADGPREVVATSGDQGTRRGVAGGSS